MGLEHKGTHPIGKGPGKSEGLLGIKRIVVKLGGLKVRFKAYKGCI